MTPKVPPQPSDLPPIFLRVRLGGRSGGRCQSRASTLHWKRCDGAAEHEGIRLDRLLRHRMAFSTVVDVVRYGWSDDAQLFVWSWAMEKIPPHETLDWPRPPAE
jgi:hypothetical protein